MLYLRALLHGLARCRRRSGSCARELDERARARGLAGAACRARTRSIRRRRAHRTRTTRSASSALSRYAYTTGRPISELQRATREPACRLARCATGCSSPPSARVLHERLAGRFDAMMADGFLDEVEALCGRGDLTRPASGHARGRLPAAVGAPGRRYALQEAVQRGIAATRQLAKRQLTWIARAKRQRDWLDPRHGACCRGIATVRHELGVLGL